jgi:DNA-binding MarR family transcriptional regulator
MVTAEECAAQLLEVVPSIMRSIRAQMRSYRGVELSVPQFRSLAFITAHKGASLSDLAENIGLTLPSASKLVDGLVIRELVQRDACVDDRRRVKLSLTHSGWSTWRVAYQATQESLAELISALSDIDRAQIIESLQLLQPLFVPQTVDV